MLYSRVYGGVVMCPIIYCEWRPVHPCRALVLPLRRFPCSVGAAGVECHADLCNCCKGPSIGHKDVHVSRARFDLSSFLCRTLSLVLSGRYHSRYRYRVTRILTHRLGLALLEAASSSCAGCVVVVVR